MDIIVRAARDELTIVTTHCPSRPYLELQIPGNVAKVNSIIVRLTSRDQGFCDEQDRIGQPGYTWYELSVERPSGRNNIPRECIHQNPAGIPDWQDTVIDSSDGKGEMLQLLVDEIQPLDIIQLCPRANFIGWVNFLQKAEIEIRCTTSLTSREPASLLRPQYSKLDSDGNMIRLLELLPGHDAEMICVKLAAVDLLSPSHDPFDALSYCWGQPLHGRCERSGKDVNQLGCLEEDGSIHQVHVSPSLWGALLHLRDSNDSRFLWVDQLCINQADKDELARQVSMMGRIYSGAERVVVWLGGGDAETERAIDTVNRLLPRFHEPGKQELDDGSFKLELQDVGLDELPHKEVNRLLTLPWFWRVWVVQEVWLGRRRTFMYGRHTIEWDTIRKANVWSKYGSFEIPGIQHTNLPLIWTSFAEMDLSKQYNGNTEQKALTSSQDNLLTLVVQGLDLKASDPRDHIFGFLGLLEGAQSDHPWANHLIYPDYHKSVSEVFTDFSIWWIIRTKSLRILSAVQAIKGRTWQTLNCTASTKVPYHDQPPSDHPTWAMWYSGMRKWENESLAGSGRYRVTGDTEVYVPLIEWEGSERRHLKLRGHRIGQTHSIGPYRLRPDHLHNDMFEAFNRVFDASGSRRLYSTPVTEAFKGYKQGWDNPLQHWVAHRHGQHMPAALPCLDHSVFQLDDGEGLCPAGTRCGDFVVVLYGGDVPYILRETETDGHYTFVGECYVADRMDQNMLTPFQDKGKAPETFILV